MESRQPSARERIAILLAIPISRMDFLARARDPSWDYGHDFLSRFPTPETAYDASYQPTSAAASELLRQADGEFVFVNHSIGLHDLRLASSGSDVVVLVAHWRGYGVHERDLLDGWRARLRQPAGIPILEYVAREIVRRSGATATRRGVESIDGVSKGLVVAALNDLIEDGVLLQLSAARLNSLETHALIAQTLSRDILDEAFDGLLSPGNLLELNDGLHSLASVDAALTPTFDGVLDLSCCTSSVLGTYLKLVRGDALQVMIGDHLVVPAPQLRLIESALNVMRQQPMARYVATKTSLARGLRDRSRRHLAIT